MRSPRAALPERNTMNLKFLPEGELLGTKENRDLTSARAGLERAMMQGEIIEGIATVCDESLCLHVDLGCMRGMIPAKEAVFCRTGEARKDIAIVSRVGKPVAVKVQGFTERNGEMRALLSRRAAQADCLKHYLKDLRPGDIIPGRVTHLEPFGAFLDIGCGVAALLSVDCISVSRISHPRDRLAVGMRIPVAVKQIDQERGRIAVTLRELLGTWEENAAAFVPGQTVTGIVRSVESYGAFIELAPNLAGLSEVRTSEQAEAMRALIGHAVAVYIKSISPERMKVKLVVVDAVPCHMPPKAPVLFVDPEQIRHMDRWVYSPPGCRKRVETLFE